MNRKPTVSCIINFLNAQEFIEEAIQSVFAQTYDHWELFLVDDGSTDKSTEIAQQYAKTYPEKVFYLEHENHKNLGTSASRNKGISNAKGKYIAFLDADDIWLALKLEKQVDILERYADAGMVYGSTLMWYGWTGNAKDIARDRFRELGLQPDTLVQPPNLLTLFLQGKAETPATCGVLIRRQLIEAVGGFEPMFRDMFDDQVFFAKLCLKAPVFVESGHWDKYRQHPNSTCAIAKKTGKYHTQHLNPTHLNYLKWLKIYFSQVGIKDIDVNQALEETLRQYRHPIYIYYQTKQLLKFVFRQKLLKYGLYT